MSVRLVFIHRYFSKLFFCELHLSFASILQGFPFSTKMSFSSGSNPVILHLNIGDQLTSISCGHIVVELVKFIAYQRQQIPYAYQWLKQVVNKKKSKEDDNNDSKESYQSERHFHVVSTALENLDFILKSLSQEINGTSLPNEVCIALGGTTFTLKEVYRLILPTECHKPQCQSTHIATDQKIQQNVFRSLAEKLTQVFFTQMTPTNMYVFLRKKCVGISDITNYENFQEISGYRIPSKSKIVVIDFRTQNIDSISCCNKIEIFGDARSPPAPVESAETAELDQEIDYHEIESTDTTIWYQSSYTMKGFKEAFVNGNSVTNLWMN